MRLVDTGALYYERFKRAECVCACVHSKNGYTRFYLTSLEHL